MSTRGATRFDEGRRIVWRTCSILALITTAILFAVPREAAANCPNGSTVQAVPASTSGSTLITLLATATSPCTLNLAPGTYTAPSGSGFEIRTGITLRGTGGSSQTTLQVSAFAAISIWPNFGSCPSGATVEGLTLSGGAWGVFAGTLGPDHLGCNASNQVTGLLLRDLVVDNAPTSGHGINFSGVQNSVIDSCTIVNAYANGIILTTGSRNNIVMNNVIQHTMTQHGIALQDSDDNVVVGNTINGSAFDGIILLGSSGLGGPGSSRNRIERNTISGHLVDGITLTDGSRSNYLGLNTAVSPSYDPITKPVPSPTYGTGIWINNASNGNYLFGNDLSGSPENGIDVLTSRSTYLQANRVHGNYQGGIWVADIHDSTIDPSAPPPQDTVIQNNTLFFNAMSANVFLQGASASQIAYNYMGGTQSPLSLTLPSISTVGFRLLDAGSVSIFENTVNAVSSRGIVTGTSSGTAFRNRFLRGTNVPNPPQMDGLNGTTYSFAPTSLQWDGGSFLGGNFWNEVPSAAAPYTGFIGNTNGGPYVDHYPYPSEALQTPGLTSGINISSGIQILEPAVSSALAAGTKRTISWIARGCALMDLYYGFAGANLTLIASSVPNTGFYFWTVPAVTFRSDYFVHAVCANSSGAATGATASSSTFTIGSGSLVLLTPGRGARVVNNSVLRVAWRKNPSVTGVNIFVRNGTSSETQVATNASGTFADITLPASVSNSNSVRVRIQSATDSTSQDSVDGTFMVRGSSPSFPVNLTGLTFQVGQVQRFEWNGRSDSYLVDLDLVLGAGTVSLVRNLPDFGTYTVLTPDIPPTTNARIRVTFKDAAGNGLSSLDTAVFNINKNSALPPVPPVNNPAGPKRLFDSDNKTDLVVFRPSNGTWLVRSSTGGYANAGNTLTYQWGSPGDIPISADFDGDHKVDIAFFRPSTGIWAILYSSQGYGGATYGYYQWGLPGDVPLAADFDGDGKTELTVFRPSTGEWFVRYSSQNYNPSTYNVFQWGLPGDIPVIGDFDGDVKADLAVFRPSNGTWYIRFSSLDYSMSATGAYQWGLSGDIPVSGDFDGDGISDLAIYRRSQGLWGIRLSSLGYSTTTYATYQWGSSTDIPIAGDYDADGKADIAIYRPSASGSDEWRILFSSLGYNPASAGVYQFGAAGDVVLAGDSGSSAQLSLIKTNPNLAASRRDFDGDHKSDLTVFRPSNGTWYSRFSLQGYNTAAATTTQWGLPGDVPLSGDFDGDGKIELAVFRPSNGGWYIRYSSQNYNIATYAFYQWGMPGDIPLACDFDGDGKTDLTVFRPSTGEWYIRYSSQGYNAATFGLYQWGVTGDVPLATDADGDGRADLTVWRPSTGEWYIRYSTRDYNPAFYGMYQWGLSGDIPLAADFDGDHLIDLTVFRPSNGSWYVRYSSTGYSMTNPGVYQWGLPGDVPTASDFDGDGNTDLVVFRPSSGEWYIRYSTLGYNANQYGLYQWGLSGDLLLK